MARYLESKITLTAGQAAGTAPILEADTATGGGNRAAVIFGNPGLTACNLHLSSGATHGTGMPVDAASTASFDKELPGLGNALYVTGLAEGDFVVIWEA